MSRRTKLCITALFLVLLAVPVWQMGANWNAPNPLRFRVVSRHPLPNSKDFRQEELQLEVITTSTAPRYLDFAFLVRTEGLVDLNAPGISGWDMVIPANGTSHATAVVTWPLEESTGPGPAEIFYIQSSATRYQVVTWYYRLIKHLPPTLQEHLKIPTFGQSTVPLEQFP